MSVSWWIGVSSQVPKLEVLAAKSKAAFTERMQRYRQTPRYPAESFPLAFGRVSSGKEPPGAKASGQLNPIQLVNSLDGKLRVNFSA
jgi:hypothetical protein